jgi:hypothetical protein
MEVPVTCHGNFLYSVLVNVTPGEHESILKHKWYKRKGQPVAHGAGNLFNFVSNLRKQAENLFPDLLPINLKGRVVTFARVDAEDLSDLKRHSWTLTPEGYAHFWNGILKKYFTMHRYLMNFPEDLVVDHLTWNRLDNRKAHLNPCSQAENARNGAAGWNFGKLAAPHKPVSGSKIHESTRRSLSEGGVFFSASD